MEQMVPKIKSLLILATDHRDVYERRYPADANAIAAAKELVVEGALRAAERRPAAADAGNLGVLVDEQYAAPCVARARRGGLRVAMPAESGGSAELALAYGDDFLAHLRALPPDYVKVLVRWSPGDEPARKRRQAEVVQRLQAGVDELGLPLMFELLVPQAAEEPAARVELITSAMAEVKAAGAAPAVWKLEPQAGEEQYARLAEAAGGVPCVVLGAGAELAEIAEHVRTVARVDGWSGFAVGRSVWAPALDRRDAGGEREPCVEQVAAGFETLIDAYLGAP